MIVLGADKLHCINGIVNSNSDMVSFLIEPCQDMDIITTMMTKNFQLERHRQTPF